MILAVNNANGTALISFGAAGALAWRVGAVASVDEAMNWFTTELAGRTPTALGIDTLLFWQTGLCGWREADKWLKSEYSAEYKKRLGRPLHSVKSANELMGCMVVQGMALAIRATQAWPGIVLNESHPKMLYFALTGKRHDFDACGTEMTDWLRSQIGANDTNGVLTDDMWDALASAWAAHMGNSTTWPKDLVKLASPQSRPIFPAGPVSYFWPNKIDR